MPRYLVKHRDFTFTLHGIFHQQALLYHVRVQSCHEICKILSDLKKYSLRNRK